LLGGHTGIDIDKGRANALILAARLLNAAMTRDNISSLQLQSLSGGNAPNAIPRDATFVVVLPSKESEALFRASLDKTFARIQTEFAHIERRLTKDSPTEEGPEARYEPCMVMEVTSVTTAPPAGALVTTPEQTRKLVALMLNVPHGPLKINLALDHAVDTSISFSIAKLNATAPVAAAAAAASGDGAAPVVEEDHFLVHVFARSSFEDDMLDVNSSLEALALLSGAQLKHGRGRGLNPFPGWKPRLDSPALKQVVATHRALFGKEARVYSVHAGLECGLLYGNYPGLDCVSIGPTIHHAHSPQECLMLDTVEPFYKWLKQSVVNISRASLAK
jgi:dipeptidase D